ncbi:MAG: efflux RND transporter periplasmic adaptor subunit [Alphaproteobacteria bacterium]|nr:efflux RND transporter periplasmic adaptor subunit [Alphaproteobacteria bacterium]
MFARTNLLFVAFLLFVSLTVTACKDEKAAQNAPEKRPVEVTVVTVKAQKLPLFSELTGRTSAFRVAEVRPQVSGIILKRLFKEGSDVKEGDQLYQIDPAPYEAALQSAKADLAKAKANLKSIQARAKRYEALVKIKAVSQQDYDDTMAGLSEAEAQILVAEAAVKTAQINLNYTKVYAPINGRTGKSNVTEGALVTANQAMVLASITQLDPIYVDITQSSSALILLRQEILDGSLKAENVKSAPVKLMLDATAKPYAYPGKLEFSDVTVEESTGSIQLRAIFPNPEGELLPGLFVRARIEQGTKENAILVPQQAVSRTSGGGASVWVVGSDNIVHVRSVKLAQAIGDNWLVEDGLKDGEKVVTEGTLKIREGATVHATEAANETPADKH